MINLPYLRKHAVKILLFISIILNSIFILSSFADAKIKDICTANYMHLNKACNAVDVYCQKTADTGQMDEFLESPEGKTFYSEYSKTIK